MSATAPQSLIGIRNARVLALCQGLYVCAISVDLTLTGIAGYQLAPDKALATLPFALITVGAAVVTVLAAFIMARFGRRLGFALGAACGALGGVVSVWAIVLGDFWLFCLGTAGVGAFQGFAQFYSIAAADGVEAGRKSRVIATVLAGGVIAAIAGPALANWTRDLIPAAPFAGAYAMVAALAFVSTFIFLAVYRDTEPVAAAVVDTRPARPLGEIVRQPILVAGVATTMVASASMLLVMTAAPLAALACGYSIDDGAGIIQWHLIGMFAPSFITGRLATRFGVPTVLFAGLALTAAGAATALASTALPAFYVALFAIGIGWNFMIVSGTTLISQSYRPNERGKTQALTGLMGNLAATASTLSAGAVFNGFGWSVLNYSVAPLLVICALVVVWWLAVRTRGSSAQSA
jgi:MFS family permease